MDESWTATVSTQTVEKGFNISDNINIEPEVYSIEAVISSYSLFVKDKEISWDGSRFKNRGQVNKDLHIKARDELTRIFKEGSILTLLESTANSNNTDLVEQYKELKSAYVKEIEDCVITSMSISHPSSGTGAFFVSLKIQKVYTANVKVEELPEGQSVPLLTPLQAKESNVSSNTNSGKVSDGDVNADGMAVMPEDDTGVPTPSTSSGMSWEEGYAYVQADLARMTSDNQALLRIHKYQLRTKSRCTLEKLKGGGYKGLCTRG